MKQQDGVRGYLDASLVRERPLRERVGVYIQANDAVDAITRIREAEQAGFRQVWMAMGGAGFADVLTALAGVATQTESIVLGTSIVPAYTRHPLVMAQQALAIHDLAPGRLRLGIGPGNPAFLESRYGQLPGAPLSYLREYLAVLRGLLWEGKVDFRGTFFQVADTLPRTAPVPLLISSLGLKAFRLAGEMTDGALTSLCPVPYLVEQALPAVHAGAEAGSRPAPPVIACLPVALSTNEAAVDRAVGGLIRQLGQAHARMLTQAGWASAVRGDEAALHTLVRDLVISGSETMVQARVRELLTNGLDELLLLPIPIADEALERTQLLRLPGFLS